MDITVFPCKLSGTIRAIPSKSQAHRLLICAAFSDRATFIECPQTNEDIEATVRCLHSLGSCISRTENGYRVEPVSAIPQTAVMDCGESGSTLRFILPIVCALGVSTTIQLHGRLPHRPLSPLWEELERMGCILSRPCENIIQTQGRLHPGQYSISGNVSSQFITGLLFALSLLDGSSTITVTGMLESKPYVDMTQLALKTFGVKTENFKVTGCFPFHTPGKVTVEGDWSNGAFFLGAKALGNSVEIINLDSKSPQGDRVIEEIFSTGLKMPKISAADIPDLVPIMAVVFAAKEGAYFTDIERLRLKESDRVASVCEMINRLGGTAYATENTLTVLPGQFHSCSINASNDHRIAMAAAIAATVTDGPVTILGAQCVAKSYPAFWQDFRKLGGKYEQYLR